MIPTLEIRAALSDLLRNKAGFPYEVHFDNNIEASKSYFYVDISERRKTVDPIYYERNLSVDIQLVLLPNEFNRIKKSELYEAEDKLNEVIRPVIQIGDRFITVLETRGRIFDGVLHYEFNLEFVDSLPYPEFDLMEELDIDLSTKTIN